MVPVDEFPSERLRWIDDLLLELEKFAARYDLPEFRGDVVAARRTLRSEAERVNRQPSHPIHHVRGVRDN
ncbi:MAG: hypothetical protein QNJ13_06075 [Paracoccaceae bacterium]|nr:hypothetical protein [Paracoccaceae bacterium]